MTILEIISTGIVCVCLIITLVLQYINYYKPKYRYYVYRKTMNHPKDEDFPRYEFDISIFDEDTDKHVSKTLNIKEHQYSELEKLLNIKKSNYINNTTYYTTYAIGTFTVYEYATYCDYIRKEMVEEPEVTES